MCIKDTCRQCCLSASLCDWAVLGSVGRKTSKLAHVFFGCAEADAGDLFAVFWLKGWGALLWNCLIYILGLVLWLEQEFLYTCVLAYLVWRHLAWGKAGPDCFKNYFFYKYHYNLALWDYSILLAWIFRLGRLHFFWICGSILTTLYRSLGCGSHSDLLLFVDLDFHTPGDPLSRQGGTFAYSGIHVQGQLPHARSGG